ncbi:hypothetical protein BJX68DRAFT_250339 [Aspergillus pseudodeflectus]|uniref:FAD-binding PCMH-type domain-containing protein n=1 Tax=Aspergillus pseudodeflectus TaxID=176178 RepID=A0ABR4JCD6_9EURO
MGSLTTMLLTFALLALHLSAPTNGQHLLPGELSAAVANATIGNCQQACAQLQAPTDLPADFAKRYFATQQQELRPLCVVQPESPEDVSRAVQVVREHQCRFAVKGGGHGNHAGASSIQDGLLIDMSRLSSVKLSDDESIAGLGAGARWIDVYKVLEEKGLTVVGGRSSTVGVGGFTLGGGISFLSRRYGWAVDNVANYELVLANGTITNVNQSSHPDLYFALRGGGNNFGIVTRFDFETRRHSLVSGGTIVFLMQDLEERRAALGLEDRWELSKNSILNQVNKHVFRTIGRFGLSVHSRDVIRAFVALADESQTDAGAHAYLFLSWVPSYHAYFYGMTTLYSGPEASPAVFQNISSMKRLYTTQRTANISDFANEIDAQNMDLVNRRNIWRTVTLKVDATLMSDIIDIFLSAVHPYTSIPDTLMSCNMQMLTKHEIEIFAKNGGNALGISPEDGPLFVFTLTPGHSNAADDARFEALNDEIMGKVISIAKERGLYHPFIYQNYAGQGQDVFAGYGAENRARLSEIQKRYDPEGVFWKLQPGYFKV